MLSVSDVFIGMGLPALVGVVLFFEARGEFADSATRYGGYSLDGAIAVGLGFLLGYCGLNKSAWFPIKEPTHWLFLGTVAIMPAAVAHQFLWRSDWLWRAASLVILAVAIGGIFSLLADSDWTIAAKIAWGIAVWIAAAIMTVALEFMLRLAPYSAHEDFAAGGALAIVSGLAAGVIGMSGSQTYGQIAAVIPAVLFPMVLLSPVTATRIISAHVAPLYVLLVDGMLLCAYLYVDLTPLNAILLFLSPLGLLADLLPVIRKRGARQIVIAQLLAVAIPAGTAFAMALFKFVHEMSGEFGAY